MEQQFMEAAIRLSGKCLTSQCGGPFGAVIVKEGKIIAEGWNTVLGDKDPTAHAEVNVIRKAAAVLNNNDLSDCELYTSCEPCPMCLGAIYWARIPKIYYANTQQDAAAVGFDDSWIQNELKLPADRRSIPMIRVNLPAAQEIFRLWEAANGSLY